MIKDLTFYTLYLIPFAVLLLYRDGRVPYVLKVCCTSALMLFYMLYNHVGLLFLYRAAPGGTHQLLSVNADTVLLLAFYNCVVVAAYVGSGIILGRRVTRFRVPDLTVLRATNINWFPLVFTVLLLTPLAVWKVMSGSPLLLLLQGNAMGALEARVGEVTTGQSFLGIKPSYIDALWAVFAFVWIVSVVIAMTRRTFWPVVFCAFVTVVNLVQSFSGVSKGAIMGPLYVFFFVYSLVLARGVLANRMIGWGAIYVIGPVSVFAAWGQDRVSSFNVAYFLYPLERLTLGNLLPQYVVVDGFGFGNLLHGTTVPSWWSFGQHKQFLLDVWAWKEIMRPAGDFFYTAPSSFVAEAHANFHVFGVLVITALVFLALRGIDYLISGVRSELIFSALMVDSSLHFFRLSITGASTFVIDYGYWGILIFGLVVSRFTLTGHTRPQTTMSPVPIPTGGT